MERTEAPRPGHPSHVVNWMPDPRTLDDLRHNAARNPIQSDIAGTSFVNVHRVFIMANGQPNRQIWTPEFRIEWAAGVW